MSIRDVRPFSVRLLRWTIWCEIVLILGTVGFGILEGYHEVLKGYCWAEFIVVLLACFTLVGSLSLFLVPPVLLVLTICSGLAGWQRLAAAVLAIALPCAHFVALAPLM